jgi:IclR family transcriptional regulator, acetate operon repressor
MMAKSAKETQNGGVKSASRAIDILEMVVRAAVPPTFNQISQQLKIPNGSLSLLLDTLTKRGYLEHVASRGGYRMGLATERLAHQVGRVNGHMERIIPILRRVAGRLNETTGYYERRDEFIECIETEPSKHPLTYRMHIGERVRMYASSSGKAILASMRDRELTEFIARTELKAYTDHTITNPKLLMREIKNIRASGVARSFNEYIPGVVAIAVVLRKNGSVVGALSVVVPESRYRDSEDRDQLIVEELQLGAREFGD